MMNCEIFNLNQIARESTLVKNIGNSDLFKKKRLGHFYLNTFTGDLK